MILKGTFNSGNTQAKIHLIIIIIIILRKRWLLRRLGDWASDERKQQRLKYNWSFGIYVKVCHELETLPLTLYIEMRKGNIINTSQENLTKSLSSLALI